MIKLLIFLCCPLLVLAQSVKIVPPPSNISAIYFSSQGKIQYGIPILELGQSFSLHFDDLQGDEAFYYYQIHHYDYDWKPSPLSVNNVIDGFDDVRILDVYNSENTLQNYTHYELKIPNTNTYALRQSGNYLIEIYDEEGNLLFNRKLLIYTNGTACLLYTSDAADD